MGLLVVGLVVGLVALPPGGTFVDDDGSVHEGSIEAVAAEGITEGCNPPAGTRFCPDRPVTRAQMATFLARALHLEASDIDHFVDDGDSVHRGAIDRLAAAGITAGCNPPDNDRFCPGRIMTRGEMAAMLVRGFEFPAAADDPFHDADGSVFETAIGRLAAAGITAGCNPPDNDRFCPEKPVTRGQMATFLTRALRLEPNPPPTRRAPVVEVRARETWGARPADVELLRPHEIERLTVHHAGSQSGTIGPAQYRGWQNWHMDGQGWGDIAYHLVIGIDGTVYEGRDRSYRGDSGTVYDTGGHLLVVIEGNFDVEKPTVAQVQALARVAAWASDQYGISPDDITGHRDHAATSCPGAHLHELIESGALAAEVDEVIESGGVDLIWPQSPAQ